jgi:transcriptional regulator with XRE-family HTH domain
MEFSLEALGQVIRELRVAKDMTQDELGGEKGAQYGGGAAVSISRIEKGLTRPRPERLAGIAAALDCTPGQLEAAAAKRTLELFLGEGGGDSPGGAHTAGDEEGIKDRERRVRQEIERRTTVITEFGDAFNEAHDRARDDFFLKFVEIARGVEGAPQPDPEKLQGEDVTGAEAEAISLLRSTSYGVAHMLAGGAGGAAAGAAVGGAAAYGTFVAAATFGTASTGAAISGLSGVAAYNAALALLGGGTLAAGGAGVTGGIVVLAGIVAAPVALLGAGGVVLALRRNRKQQQERTEKLKEADAALDASRRAFEAVDDFLPRATETLDYIAVHAAHALNKWEAQLGPRPLDWASLEAGDQQSYLNFIEVSTSQLLLLTIDWPSLMASRGDNRERLIELADEVLNQSQAVVEALV